LVARVALGLVLISAGGLKVADPNEAITAVTAYQILPDGLATLVGYGLPFFEIMLGLFLVIGLATRASAATAGVLMVVFIAAVSSAWARGLSIDCGCFGGGGATENPAYLPEILRDLLFLGLACWLVIFPASLLAVDRLGWFGTASHGLVDELIEGAEETDDLRDPGESGDSGDPGDADDASGGESRSPETMELPSRRTD
jgi:uncharacterized membrane protein YphA (DoxX/SURF4 family)